MSSGNSPKHPGQANQGMRLDKWLWVARFYKTRSVAAEDIGRGRVSVNGQLAKASRELRLADMVEIRQTGKPRVVQVLALSAQRGPAPVAQALYEETAASQQARAELAEARRLAPEPALAMTQGRPTKRDRRALAQAQAGGAPDWQRWSASIPDLD